MTPPPDLARGLGFWQATAINLTQIVGAGVFLTIPLILEKLPGAWAASGCRRFFKDFDSLFKISL